MPGEGIKRTIKYSILVPCCSDVVFIVWLWLVFVVLHRNSDSKHLSFPVVQSISSCGLCSIFFVLLCNIRISSLFAQLAAFYFYFFLRHVSFSLSPLQHWVIPNSDHLSRSYSISSRTGLLHCKSSSAWNCCTCAQTLRLNPKTLSLAHFFFHSLLKALRMSLHSSEKCLSSFLDFRSVRTASKSTNQQNVWSHSGDKMRPEAMRLR